MDALSSGIKTEVKSTNEGLAKSQAAFPVNRF